MEERKERIVRKYLREHATITQSDMVVPSDLPEDERITDSEKFQDAEIDLQKHDGTTSPMMPPPPQQRPLLRAESNWLLDDAEVAETDMFGNPVVTSDDDSWSSWSGDTEETKSVDNRRSSDRRYDPYGREGRGGVDGRGQQDTTLGGRFQRTDPQTGSSSSIGSDIFGRSQTPSSFSSGIGVQGNTRTYGSSPDQGLLSTPFPKIDSSAAGEEGRSSGFGTRSSQGYQPYKSPYEQQREDRQKQPWGTTSPSQEQQEFKRPNSYEQWKDRNKVQDPTADDAYTNPMMNQNRR